MIEIIAPAVMLPPAIAFLTFLYHEIEIEDYLKKLAHERVGMPVEELFRRLQWGRMMDKLEKREAELTEALDTWIVRRVLLNQAADGTPLTPEQVQQFKEAEQAMRVEYNIWTGSVRLIPASGKKC